MILRRKFLVWGLLLAALLPLFSGCSLERVDSPDMHEDEEHQNLSMDIELPDVKNPVTSVYVPKASFDEDEIGWPRLEVYVYPKSVYYYISVDPGLAERVAVDLAECKEGNPSKTDDILGYTTASPDSIHPQIAYSPAFGSWQLLSQNINGEYFWGTILMSADSGDALMDRAREATGWQLRGNPIMVEGITEISIYLGAECVETITDVESITNFEEYLHHGLAPSYVPKTPEHHIEICCKLHNGETISFVTDADTEYAGIWVPPCYYYVCKGATEGLLEALGLNNWPEKILEMESMIPYPREIIDQLFKRVDGQIALG